jgi:transcriptional regulator with XRE-family HTH domain
MPRGERNKLDIIQRLEIYNLRNRLHQDWKNGLKVSSKNIASKYGISQTAVYKIWKNEKNRLDGIIIIEKLVKLFGKSIDYIPDKLKTEFLATLSDDEKERIRRLSQ